MLTINKRKRGTDRPQIPLLTDKHKASDYIRRRKNVIRMN